MTKRVGKFFIRLTSVEAETLSGIKGAGEEMEKESVQKTLFLKKIKY